MIASVPLILNRRKLQAHWPIGLGRVGEEVLLERSALLVFLELGGFLVALMSNDQSSLHFEVLLIAGFVYSARVLVPRPQTGVMAFRIAN